MKYLKILGIDFLVGLVVYMFLNYFSYIFFGVNLVNEFGFDCLVGWFLGIFFGWGVVTLYFVSKDVRFLKNNYKQLYLEECEKNRVLREELRGYEAEEMDMERHQAVEPKTAKIVSLGMMPRGDNPCKCSNCGYSFDGWAQWGSGSDRCGKCGAIFIK